MTPSLEEFTRLVSQHDISYAFSDDHSVWSRGERAYSLICSMRDALIAQDANNESRCIEIWNDNVRKKFVESVWKQFEWKAREKCLNYS